MTRDLGHTPHSDLHGIASPGNPMQERPSVADAALGAVLGRCGQRLTSTSQRLLAGRIGTTVAVELAAEVVADVVRALARAVSS